MKPSHRILLITDSNAMPRPGIAYEDTWIYLLKRHFNNCDIIDRPGRGSSTDRLVTEGGMGLDLLENYRPRIVILQLGYADCSPRLFDKTKREYRLIQRLPAGLRKRYIDYVRTHRGRQPHVTEVTRERFQANLSSYFSRAEKLGTTVIVLMIHRATTQFLQKSPHIQRNVDDFNALYRKIAAHFQNVILVEPFDAGIDMDSLCIDELHVNPEGNRMIFNKLEPLVARVPDQ